MTFLTGGKYLFFELHYSLLFKRTYYWHQKHLLTNKPLTIKNKHVLSLNFTSVNKQKNFSKMLQNALRGDFLRFHQTEDLKHAGSTLSSVGSDILGRFTCCLGILQNGQLSVSNFCCTVGTELDLEFTGDLSMPENPPLV